MSNKICSQCNTNKHKNNYHKHSGHKDGLASKCKECIKKIKYDYTHSLHGKISVIYLSQQSSSRDRGHSMPNYTKEELSLFMFKNGYKEKYNQWKASGYNSKLAPSIDRLNDYAPYTIDNIQLVTWGENENNGYTDRKNGRNNKVNRAVKKYSLEGELLEEYHSIMQASRDNNINNSHIVQACKGKISKAYGFIWRYSVN